jgi:Flp pilus assembly protein TadD
MPGSRRSPPHSIGLLLVLAACSGGELEDSLKRPEVFVREILLSERTALAAQAEIEGGLREALTSEPGGRTPVPFLEEFRARFPAPGEGTRVQDEPLTIERYSRDEHAPLLGVATFLARLRAHVQGWRGLARATFETDRFFLDRSLLRATGRAEIALAGERADGSRESLRAVCGVELVQENLRWKLGALELFEGTRITSRVPPFVDATRACGLDEGISRENSVLFQSFVDQHVTLAHGGLTALDWNHDGFLDLLATRQAQTSTLFLNDGAGGFVPGELPLRTASECPSSFLWLDLDDDGLEELVGATAIEYEGTHARLPLWTRREGSWERRPDALVFPVKRGERRIAIQTLVPCDVDADGRIDLFAGVYGDAVSRGTDFNTVEAHDGGDNLLFVNHGDLHFSEESDERGIHGTQYTYVGFAFDFDADGDEDLWEGNDFGPNILWENDGAGRFHERADSDFSGHSAYTMGVSMADYDNEGVWSLYVANMSSEAGQRICAIADGIDEPMRARIEGIASGGELYRQSPDGKSWSHVPDAAGTWEGEWSWGSVFFDVDGDGDEDLYVTNGFTSHSRPELPDWDSHYWRQVVADGGFLMRGQKSVDVNADDPSEGSFSGHQRDRLFYNLDEENAFVDAAWVFGLDQDHDGRSVVPLDVDGDGDLDLALWTLQGLRLYLRQGAPASFTCMDLTATSSQHHALGAVVTVEAGGRVQRERVRCVEGFQSQLPLRIHAGLGAAERIDRVSIEWPSGAVEEHRDLPARKLLAIREGEKPRVSDLPCWPASSVVPSAATCEAECARLTRTRHAGPVVVHHPSRDPTSKAPLLGERLGSAHASVSFLEAPPADADSTWIFDDAGRLARAFERPVSDSDVEAFLALLADEPAFPELLAETGRRELREGRLRPALDLFDRALTEAPELAWAWEGKGRAHVALGREDLAEQDYARSVEVDPDYALGWYNLGIARTHLGRPDEALAPLHEAIAIEGERFPMLLALGEAAAMCGEGEIAIDAFARAARADPTAAEPLVLQAKVLARCERYEEARERLTEALAREPDHEDARRVLAAVREAQAADHQPK